VSGAPFKVGELYASKSAVRAYYREYWKGILPRDGRVGIIHAYRHLARRIHYADVLDPVSMTLTYLGEGLKGDQKLTRGNKALLDAATTGDPVDVFLDCGDIQLPCRGTRKLEKHLLAGGAWRVVSAQLRYVPSEARKVYRFKLVPIDEETRRVLQTIFLDAATGFERLLKKFAKVRSELYQDFNHILRARDSIAGHVGEYFAVQGFNSRFPDRPLVRVRSNFPDLDAIQTGSGYRFAVKTVTTFPQKTSNIWTPLSALPRSIDSFLILDLDPFELQPRALFRLPVQKAKPFWSADAHQGGAGKLTIDERFKDTAEQIALTEAT
jgi:hypothetical protein